MAALSAGEWALYRSHDRRRRKVAVIGSAMVETMRAEGALSALPDTDAEILVWSRRAETFAPHETVVARPRLTQFASAEHAQLRCSLLSRILLRVTDHKMRRRLAIAALNWRQDVDESEARGLGRGMNWSGILAGTRIDSSFRSEAAGLGAPRGAARLAAISRSLGKDEVRLLDLMILTDATRHAIARTLGQSDSEVEKSGLRVLRHLADLYRHAVTQPGQGSPSA